MWNTWVRFPSAPQNTLNQQIMRKFKLIKEYPGSPKLHFDMVFINPYDKLSYKGEVYTIVECERYPEFWQEIKEKKYEILSFQATTIDKTIYKKDVFGGYSTAITNSMKLEKCLKDKLLIIYSIKRLADNEIFTVGDETEQGVIKSFVESQEGLHIGIAKTWNYLERLTKKSNMVLFTTVDKVKIMDNYKGNLYLVDKATFDLKTGIIISMNDMLKTYSTSHLIFHSFEKAKDFITRNKPCLSLKEISQIYITANKYDPKNPNPQGQAEKLYNFVQYKLKL